MIAFTESTGSNGQTLTLTTAGAVNFENLLGSAYQETLQGDANNNWIAGDDGVDTLYGNAGNDRLAAGGYSVLNYDDDDDASFILNSVNDSMNNDNDVIYGGAGNDSLYGSAGDNTLDGGTGTDTIWSGTGSDTIVIRSGDGSTTLANADVLRDFSDGNDVIGMDGLNYGDLTIAQGTGDYSSHVVVKYGTEFLLIIRNVSVSNMTSPDFTPL